MDFVLLVDDYQPHLNCWRRDLSRDGKRVATALTRLEAKAIATAKPPDVALIDVKLGGESGFDVLQDLKAIDPQIFVILVSSYMNVAWAMHAIRAGADHCFIKPILCKQIVALVERDELPEPKWDHPRMDLDQVEWEHFCRVLTDCDNNVSLAARCMKMHVTTLRRKLEKHGVLPLPRVVQGVQGVQGSNGVSSSDT